MKPGMLVGRTPEFFTTDAEQVNIVKSTSTGGLSRKRFTIVAPMQDDGIPVDARLALNIHK